MATNGNGATKTKTTKRARAPKAANGGRTPMTDTHKAALAEGREQGRAVRLYLDALAVHRPKRGRKRDLSKAPEQIAAIEEMMADADPLTRLQLAQQRIDLQAAVDAVDDTDSLAEAEEGFVAAAAGYSERKGITYAAWREAGVAPDVLKRAGISRSS